MSKEQIEEMADAIYINCPACLLAEEAEMIAKFVIEEQGYRKQSEVVRCKDCEHFYQDGTIKVCRHWNCHSTEDNAYCSFAKMKGEKG